MLPDAPLAALGERRDRVGDLDDEGLPLSLLDKSPEDADGVTTGSVTCFKLSPCDGRSSGGEVVARGIIDVGDVGADDGLIFLVTLVVSGRTADTATTASGDFSPNELPFGDSSSRFKIKAKSGSDKLKLIPLTGRMSGKFLPDSPLPLTVGVASSRSLDLTVE